MAIALVIHSVDLIIQSLDLIIHLTDRRCVSQRLVRKGSLSHSLSTRLIAPYNSFPHGNDLIWRERVLTGSSIFAPSCFDER